MVNFDDYYDFVNSGGGKRKGSDSGSGCLTGIVGGLLRIFVVVKLLA